MFLGSLRASAEQQIATEKMINVPQVFKDIGFSGLFHLEVEMNMSETEREECKTKVPYLIGNSGWMALQVTDEGKMVVVRKDAGAICDLFFVKRERK
jgi:hypothetical protein